MENKSMRKKLLYGILLLAVFLCMPITRCDLASGTPRPEISLPEAAPAPEEAPAVTDGRYTLSLKSSIGTLTYYNQSDVRWADYLYGGQDPLHTYGCGPTALAMIVSSFTSSSYTPSDMAAWAAEHGYWSAGHGTKHEFIPECAEAFGFKAAPFTDYSVESVLSALSGGNILIALMGPGHFTEGGHFIIIADYWSGTQVRIADPVSLENTQQPWDLQLILNELSTRAQAGGPVWSITPG